MQNTTKQNQTDTQSKDKSIVGEYWSSAAFERLKHNKNVCVVIPCYNEEKRLDFPAYQKFLTDRTTENILLLFVDDGSTDQTTPLLKSWQNSLPDAAIAGIRLSRNCGKAEAVRIGVQQALRTGVFRWIGYWDADLSTPLEDITRFHQHLLNTPALCLVMGSRCKRLGCNVERNLFRHYSGRIAATLISIKLQLPVYDTQCGAKLFTDSFARAYFQQKFSGSWLFDAELLLRLIRREGQMSALKTIEEIPVSCWIHKHGSKINFRDAGLQLIRFLFL